MPKVVQWITLVLPARHYVTILRDVFLKGTGLALMTNSLVALTLIALIVIALATHSFQKRLA